MKKTPNGLTSSKTAKINNKDIYFQIKDDID